jgi:hypothetical protein
MPNITLAGPNQALDSSLPTIYSEFKLLRDETGVMRKCSTRMDLKPHEGAAKNVNNYGRVIAQGVADGADIVNAQALADTTTSYTPGEVAVQVYLAGSTMRRVQDPQLMERTGRILANAYDLKEDSDGCAQLTSFTPIVGSAGTVISPGHLAAACGRLRIGNDRTNPEPAPKPWHAVLHPLHGVVLTGRMVPFTDVPVGTNVYGANTGAHAGITVGPGRSGNMSDNILRNGPEAEGMIGGAMVYYDANIAVDASDDASGAVFSKEGVIYVSEVEPKLDPDDSDKSMRGAVELNLWGSYVWGLYRAANYGVECLFDASLPTS